jgi:methionyl-tRNA formyltransferase
MKKKIKFSNIDNFIVFGGGELIIDICSFLLKNKKKITVISSIKQIKEKIFFTNQSIKNFCIKNKIKFIILKNLNDYSKWTFLVNKKTFGISHSCKWIFRESEIDLFQGKLINIHYSNLPSFRGGGGLTWNILTQNFNSGTTIHLIDKKIDSGFSIISKKFSFPKNIRNSLIKMQRFSIKFHKKIIKYFLINIIKEKSFEIKKIENNFKSFYWPRLKTKKNAWINWSWPAKNIVNFINAFSYPYEGAATYFNKKIIRIHKARLFKENLIFHPFQYGLIYRVLKGEAYIAAKNKSIIVDLKYLRLKNVIGKRFYTPNNKLEMSIEGVRI